MREILNANPLLSVFVASLLVVGGYWFLIPRKMREAFIALVSILFAAMLSWKYSLLFIFNTILVYVSAKTSSKQRSALSFTAILIWLIFTLAVFKVDTLSGSVFSDVLSLHGLVFPLGISYLTFRLIHVWVDTARGDLSLETFSEFAAYVFFFPTFLAGPIERYQNFKGQIAAVDKLTWADLNPALFRIGIGLFKKLILADGLHRWIWPPLSRPHEFSRLTVFFSLYGLLFEIYMDFSGYTDLALGVAGLFGIRIHENFNWPFLKCNVAQYWRNWHITLNTWIRDYFFLPIFGRKATHAKIYIGVLMTMLVFQLWHGLTLSFLILGLYYGAGLLVWQAFQDIKRKSPPLAALGRQKWFSVASTLLTWTHISLAIPLLVLSWRDSWQIFSRLLIG